MLEKVLERLATTEKGTIVIERAPEGKILVTSGSWDGEKVILRDQALAAEHVEGRTSHARIGDRPMEPADRAAHDCYGVRWKRRSRRELLARAGFSLTETSFNNFRILETRFIRVRQITCARSGTRFISTSRVRPSDVAEQAVSIGDESTSPTLSSMRLNSGACLDPDQRGDRIDEAEAIEMFLADSLLRSG